MDKALVEGFVGVQNTLGGAIFEGLDENVVAVVIVQDHHVIVAIAGGGDETAGLVGEDLSGWLHKRDVACVGGGIALGWKVRIGLASKGDGFIARNDGRLLGGA